MGATSCDEHGVIFSAEGHVLTCCFLLTSRFPPTLPISLLPCCRSHAMCHSPYVVVCLPVDADIEWELSKLGVVSTELTSKPSADSKRFQMRRL